MPTRRTFLKRLGATGLVSLSGLPPALLARASLAAERHQRQGSGRSLVVIQLAGGNDGLNTVIPYGNDLYEKNRPGVRIGKDAVLKLNDELGLHPAMGAMKGLYDDGALAIVQGVGYPNPNRSHFRSTDIWQTASLDEERPDVGWLGRAMDEDDSEREGTLRAISLGFDRLPLTLVAHTANAPNVRDVDRYRLDLGGRDDADRTKRRRLMTELARPGSDSASDLDFVRRTSISAYDSADRLQSLVASYKPAADYPRNGLGQKLQLIAQIVAAEVGTEIFFVSLGGFDTHSQQAGAHTALLGELSSALGAFWSDLKGHDLEDRVVAMTFSEFGRRVKENGSLGTDHGAASQMFVLSAQPPAGIIGDHPSLSDLDDGDLKHHTDFRSVYQAMLDDWLGYPSQAILGGNYPRLALFS
ncbi:hypothetical protein Pan216_09540 [Planctomycetes bacterium Pan216]|uniref:DUF1501 domain-containing protein n=1 Tax=Kolteria novifilia TaxID=2527975 RepID=A0A518AZD8_9BACT|nr:hypothetical protein Pan216_09540 [Planctomycetes bacterium Pan216]